MMQTAEAPEWLGQVTATVGLPEQRLPYLTDTVDSIRFYLRQSEGPPDVLKLDGRPAAIRVHGYWSDSEQLRCLSAFALDGREGGVTIERHGYYWNSMTDGCDPMICASARFLLTRGPRLKLSKVESSGALSSGAELIGAVARMYGWLRGLNGAENPQLAGRALTAAHVTMEERKHTFRMPYFGKVLASL